MSIPADRLRRRLIRVFATMFPDKGRDEFPEATMQNTKGWDSLATLSLFTLAEEEFNIKLGLDLIGETKSFSALEELVQEKLS